MTYKLPFEKSIETMLNGVSASLDKEPEEVAQVVERANEEVELYYEALRNAEERIMKETGYQTPEPRDDESNKEYLRRLAEHEKAHMPRELELHDFRNGLSVSWGWIVCAYTELQRPMEKLERFRLRKDVVEEITGKMNKTIGELKRNLQGTDAYFARVRERPLIGIKRMTQAQYDNAVRIIDEEFAKLKATEGYKP